MPLGPPPLPAELPLAPKSAGPLALLVLTFTSLILLFVRYIGLVRNLLKDSDFYNESDSELRQELDTEIYKTANTAWYILWVAVALSIFVIISIVLTATLLRGTVGKIFWILTMISLVGISTLLIWAGVILLQSVQDIEDAIEAGEGSTLSDLTIGQLGATAITFRMTSVASFIIVILSLMAGFAAYTIKK